MSKKVHEAIDKLVEQQPTSTGEQPVKTFADHVKDARLSSAQAAWSLQQAKVWLAGQSDPQLTQVVEQSRKACDDVTHNLGSMLQQRGWSG